MFFLLTSIFLYGMLPIIGLIEVDKITFLFVGLIFSILFFIFFVDYEFLKKNFTHIIISAFIRGTSSIAYFYAYDIGFGPIVVAIVFIQPLTYSLLTSFDNKCLKNMDLVIFATIGGYLLSSELPSFDFNYKLLIALISPLFSALSLYHFRKHIVIETIQQTSSVVLIRSIFIGLSILLFFDVDWDISSINILYSSIYGILVLGFAMISFFHASKLVEPKKFSLISNIEFIIAIIVMFFVFDISPNFKQIIGSIIIFASLFTLKYRNLFYNKKPFKDI